MIQSSTTRFAALAASLAAILFAGCAHAPGAPSAAKEERVMVTGSHIPQRIDPATGLAASFSPVKVFERQRLGQTGRAYDTGAALHELDPSLGR